MTAPATRSHLNTFSHRCTYIHVPLSLAGTQGVGVTFFASRDFEMIKRGICICNDNTVTRINCCLQLSKISICCIWLPGCVTIAESEPYALFVHMCGTFLGMVIICVNEAFETLKLCRVFSDRGMISFSMDLDVDNPSTFFFLCALSTPAIWTLTSQCACSQTQVKSNP